MTLGEASEILTEERKDHHSFSTDIIGQAEQLGIDALNAILLWEKDFSVVPLIQLLQKTKE